MLPVIFCVVAVALVLPFRGNDAMPEEMSIDEAIMNAADKAEMFDVMHMIDGQMMALVELDILMNMTEMMNYKNNINRVKRKAIRSTFQLWPGGNVFYEISQADFNQRDVAEINAAIDIWRNLTCLNFTQRNAGPRIFFQNGEGCSSRLGYTGSQQPINLAPNCRRTFIVAHEIGHAIGWFHEQARPDRDNYIRVNYNQIPQNWRSQFDKESTRFVDDRGVGYDYLSIMHYSGNVFGPQTIVTLDPKYQNVIGQRSSLSFRDIQLANLMYRCSAQCPSNPSCPGFVGKDCRCYCPPTEPIPARNAPSFIPCPSTPQPTAPTTAAPATRTPPVNTTAVCRDIFRNCSGAMAAGRCTRDEMRMRTLCRRTCGFCNTTRCMDMDPSCLLLSSNGYCGRFTLVDQICPLSCNRCVPQADKPCQPADIPTSSATALHVGLLSTLFVATSVLIS